VPCPRDFYASKCWWSDAGGACILDLDEAAPGAAAADWETSWPHLHYAQSCTGFVPVAPTRPLSPPGRISVGCHGAREAQLKFYTAASLLEAGVAAVPPARSDWVSRTIALSMRFATWPLKFPGDRAVRARPPRRRYSAGMTCGPRSIPQLPSLGRALDPLLPTIALGALSSAQDLSLRGIRTSLQPLQRCLIEYDVALSGEMFTVIGKVSAKGLDESGQSCHDLAAGAGRLRAGFFGRRPRSPRRWA